MEWFNVFGLIFIAVIMIPNVVFAIKCKDGFDNKWNNKYVEVTEQVGRLGCFGFMIINSTDLLIIPLNKNNIEGIIESANALKMLFFLKHIIQIAQ
nr:hypothetical protein [Agathobacter rectalis]